MIILINHQEQFERVKYKMEDLEEVYKEFNYKPTKRKRDELEISIKEFRLQLNNFICSIRNLWF